MKMLPIPGLDGRYSLTDSDNVYEKVYSHIRNRFLTPNFCNKNGYINFGFEKLLRDEDGNLIIGKNGKPKTKKVRIDLHRLVGMVFLADHDPEKNEVNHKNENIKDNSIDNLEWVTGAENKNWGTRNKRIGEKHMKQVKCLETNELFKSVKEAAAFTKVDYNGICCAARGIQNTAGGYHWEYCA